MRQNYTRWTESSTLGEPGTFRPLEADILGAPYTLTADVQSGRVRVELHRPVEVLDMDPDEARMLGVRLIEGAALADGVRAIRQAR